MKTSQNNRIDPVGIFYVSNGKWTPIKTRWTGKPRIFTSRRELNRVVNSRDFNYEKNYYLKSKISIRKFSGNVSA